jgi:hypothetical protein
VLVLVILVVKPRTRLVGIHHTYLDHGFLLVRRLWDCLLALLPAIATILTN